MTITGYVGIFDPGRSGRAVARIEIPIFQRDYAQGRDDPTVAAVRDEFLTVLCTSLLPDAEPVALDFVYGEVTDHTLIPLDGQQRLTTLFLLHWYLAYRSGHLTADQPWTRFTYGTRPSAELFCRTLVKEFGASPSVDESQRLSAWIRDQNWFLYTWTFDPTIQGMLVVVDAIADKLAQYHVDFEDAWQRLTAGEPAIWFHFRPIGDMGAETDLYIKMNSRGKPLTPYENFKAQFEEIIAWAGEATRERIARRFDIEWSNVVWKLRASDEPRDAMDDRFLRYLKFLTDVCRWLSGPSGDESVAGLVSGALGQRAATVFGSDASNREQNLHFLCKAFEVWVDRDPTETFAQLYSPESAPTSDNSNAVRLFFDRTDLFAECCNGYETTRFSIPQALILFATLVQLAEPGDQASNFPQNVRTLRNLIQATNIEWKDMPRLLPEVRSLIQSGELSDASAFNSAQMQQEKAKRSFLRQQPDRDDVAEALHRLEDHRLLRGSLAAFSFGSDPATFLHRAEAFDVVFADDADWLALSGALLAQGDYGWRRSRWHRQYGTGSAANHLASWRTLLTENDVQDRLAGTREVVMAFLDEAADSGDPSRYAQHKVRTWLADHEPSGPFDWRYYFVKYDAMRVDTSGVFYLSDEENDHRFIARRLSPGQTHQASKQRDPYLMAIKEALGPDKARVGDPAAVWWLSLWLTVNENPGARLTCQAKGFRVEMPPELEPHFVERCTEADIAADPEARTIDEPTERVAYFICTPRSHDAPRADDIDRIVLGVEVMRALIGAVDDSTR